MKRLLVSFFIVFSLMVVPVAHAAGVIDDGCQPVHAVKKDAKDGSHSKQMADTGHHCGCSAVSLRLDAKADEPSSQDKLQSIYSSDVHIASVVIGPLLKPPSYV